jgi:hypothetical protein
MAKQVLATQLHRHTWNLISIIRGPFAARASQLPINAALTVHMEYWAGICPVFRLERSRPAADATREANGRWLPDG